MVTTLAGVEAATTVCELARIRSVSPILTRVVNESLGEKIIKFLGKSTLGGKLNVRVTRSTILRGGVSKQKQNVSLVAIKKIDHDYFTKVFP